MDTYTKRAVDVWAPTTGGGALRGPANGEAQTWGIEVEANLATKVDDTDLAATNEQIAALSDLPGRTASLEAHAASTDTLIGDLGAEVDTLSDAISINTQIKDPVACASTGNLTLSGEQTIDGVLTSASRVLAKDQSTPAQIGIYVTGAGAWSRATDFDAGSEVPGAEVYVSAGTVNKGRVYRATNTTVPTIGTDAIGFKIRYASDTVAVDTAIDTRAGSGTVAKVTNQASAPAALFVNSDTTRVPVWLDKDGKLAAKALTPLLSTYGNDRWNEGALAVVRAKLAAISAGKTGIRAKIIVRGDSWAQRRMLPQLLLDKLSSTYASSAVGGTGWVDFATSGASATSASSTTPIGPCYVTVTGTWTTGDATEGTISGDYAHDGFRYTCTNAVSGITITLARFATAYLYYKDTDGTFRWRVDGGSWTTVAGGSTNASAKVTISASAGTHTVEVDTTGNTGTVYLFGLYCTGIDGVEVSKAGNGSAIATDYSSSMGTFAAAQLLDMAPDAQIIFLGTNEMSSGNGTSPLSYHDSLQTMITQGVTANASIATILIAPPSHGATKIFTGDYYRDQIKQLVEDNSRVAYLDLFRLWDNYTAMNLSGGGIWLDTLHIDTVGGTLLISDLWPFFTVR